MMPVYVYSCPACKKYSEEHIHRIEDRDARHFHMTCPIEPGQVLLRDLQAEHSPRNAEEPEYYSDALGVHPSQIAEAKSRFPGHDFSPDGRMRIKNASHRRKVMKELGMRDWNSFY